MSKECINYYDGNSDNKLYFSSLVDLNLLNLPNQELSYLQSRSNNPNPKDSTDNRFDGLDISYTDKILNSFNQHPIASFSAADRKYSRTDTEIGYCFGRAMYFHQLLLRATSKAIRRTSKIKTS